VAVWFVKDDLVNLVQGCAEDADLCQGVRMPADDVPPRDLVQAAERSFAIIRAFGQHRQTLTQSQVAEATGLSRATARRFLQSMEVLGYVGRDGRDYYLRPRVLDLGYAYLSSMTLWDVAKSQMELLVQQVQESSSASVLDGTDIIFTVRVPTKRIMSVQVEIGTRFPAHATSMGRVLLADLPPDALDGYFGQVVPEQLTPRSVTSVEELRVILKEVASQGWCLLDEELEEGVRSLAVPLHDKRGTVIAAMNVCAHASRVSAQRIRDEFLPPLLQAAATVDRYTCSRA
jgi:IclR family pca regulon transcriptional regulator